MESTWKSLLVPATVCFFLCRQTTSASNYLVCVSNEKSGDITLIDGATGKVTSTIPVGKRPRGIHVGPDGEFVYVALSGTPISGLPQLDAAGNPILDKDDDQESDRSADGIGVVDLKRKVLVKHLPGGSDPEQIALTPDGKRVYISNEDVGTVSLLNVTDGKIERIIPVKAEPEGVVLSPDEKFVYVTCETNGNVFVIKTANHEIAAEFDVPGRPRNVAFLPDGSRAFVPSESKGTIHVIETTKFGTVKIIELPPGSRPMGTVVSKDGKSLYVTTGRAGNVCVINTQSLTVTNSIKVGTRPWGIEISPDDKLLFVANGPSNDVSIIDTASEKEIGRVAVGTGPWGISITKELE